MLIVLGGTIWYKIRQRANKNRIWAYDFEAMIKAYSHAEFRAPADEAVSGKPQVRAAAFKGV